MRSDGEPTVWVQHVGHMSVMKGFDSADNKRPSEVLLSVVCPLRLYV